MRGSIRGVHCACLHAVGGSRCASVSASASSWSSCCDELIQRIDERLSVYSVYRAALAFQQSAFMMLTTRAPSPPVSG